MNKIEYIIFILFMKKLLVLFFFLTIATYYFTSAGKTPYDYFTRLSDAFLQGKYYLTKSEPWLNELIPAGNDKYFVAYPPMPAILAIPFRFVFGEKFEQQFLAHILGGGVVVLSILISWSVKRNKKIAVWSGLLTAFGNIIWYMAATGSVWYLGQICAMFFLMLAIYESLNKKRPVLIGLVLGAAYLSRIETAISFPFFLYVFNKNHAIKNYFKIALSALPFLLVNFLYNFIRFGVVWDKGYMLIPGVMNEIWYQNGLVNLINIPNHLKVIFLAMPKIIPAFPYIIPSWAGLAIWITTPAFIYSIFANLKEKIVKASWLSIVAISLLIFSHGTTGFAQFGYRFAMDFYPFLIFLTIKGVTRTGLKWHNWVLLSFSILVNLWGVIFINKLGWVGY